MAKTYRATKGFSCPADPESMKRLQSARKLEAGEKREALLAQVAWMDVEKGAKVEPYNDFILRSLLENECVEEVKANG